MWYSYKHETIQFIEIKVERVNDIIALNKKGQKPADLVEYVEPLKKEFVEPNYANVDGQDSLTRFDRPKNNNQNKNNNNRNRNNRNRNKNNNKKNNNTNPAGGK